MSVANDLARDRTLEEGEGLRGALRRNDSDLVSDCFRGAVTVGLLADRETLTGQERSYGCTLRVAGWSIGLAATAGTNVAAVRYFRSVPRADGRSQFPF
jgi:hypothetical protein